MSGETRVVLVKPGDVLLIGNIGPELPDGALQVAAKLHELIGIRVGLFADDIDIAALTAEELAALLANGETAGG